ncbi:MAG TPA: hypothetical protein VGA08_00180 [Candidatus Saccharimonadales bacterium]
MPKLDLPYGFKDPVRLLHRLHVVAEPKWVRRGELRALKLFHEMAARVPAYKDFLKSNKFNSDKVKTIQDFKLIPVIDKDNYLRRYPKEMLVWDGDFSGKKWVISSTSGSTGEPYYFPREESQDWQYAVLAEMYLRHNFDIDKKSTLYIVAFPMGAWIGGLFTYEALKILAERGDYDLSVITPGIHKIEVINAIKQLGSKFDQIIIGSYAPFLKDILDDGTRAGIKWRDYDLGFIFSAESFSENFRDFIIKRAGLKNPLSCSLNHYGTVDMGTMAHETPISIAVRRRAFADDKLRQLLFPEPVKQPTFAQYIPELFYFEEQDYNLICSAYSGIPLVRYNLKDYGGLCTKQQVINALEQTGQSVDSLLHRDKINKKSWNLPFVYVYERNDFSISYYAFLVYPDTIRRALQNHKLHKYMTGKFTALVEYDNDGRQKLKVHAELRFGQKPMPSLIQKVNKLVHDSLFNDSSEYRELFRMIGEVSKPEIITWPYEDPTYFKPGTKQKWVIK